MDHFRISKKQKEKSKIEKVTAGRDAMGVFAPKFAELNDDVLFGQVWAREEQLSALGHHHAHKGGAGLGDRQHLAFQAAGHPGLVEQLDQHLVAGLDQHAEA